MKDVLKSVPAAEICRHFRLIEHELAQNSQQVTHECDHTACWSTMH